MRRGADCESGGGIVSARARARATPDLVLLLAAIALIVVGVEMVYSASFVMAQSQFKDGTYFLTRHVMFAAVGFAGLVAASAIDYHRLERISLPLMVGTVLALIAVLAIGSDNYGARRWFPLGPLPPIQPSEFAKLATVIYMSHWLAGKGSRVKEIGYTLVFALLLIVVTALVMVEPDMGTSFVLVATAVCVFFVAGANLFHFLLVGVGSAVGFVYLIAEVDFRHDRMKAFLDPWADPTDSGWHTIQTLIALGSGGVTGLGLGASRQKFYYVPNAHTDAIFAIIGEEMGLLGAAAVILLFTLLAWRGFRIAFRAPDQFGKLLATGITCLIVVQAVTNIAVVTSTVPYTGITLPFISYGGSSLVVSMIGVGLLLGISRHDGVVARAGGARVPAATTEVSSRASSRRVAASGANLALPRRSRTRRGTQIW